MSTLRSGADGLLVFRNACRDAGIDVPSLVARCCKWVAPETFQRLPVWYPESWRGAPICDSGWTRQYTNRKRSTGHVAPKTEPNIRAAWALWQALGYRRRRHPENWSVCHLWSVDDPKFQKTNTVVQDARYYSCVANMVALPTPLKAITDADPEVKRMLRLCAYHLYGWVCDAEDVREEADDVRRGVVPYGYPRDWPSRQGDPPPPGVIPYSPEIQRFIDLRMAEIRTDLEQAGELYPREEVRRVLAYWKIDWHHSVPDQAA